MLFRSGYFNAKDETEKAFEDGWFHTGDIGTLSPDGQVFIKGRKKEMIISGGINIYTDDLERVLNEHPAVSDSAVIGVPHADFGEGVTFEELGIDFLVVDEAHLFKNLRIATRHTRVKGIGKSASQRAEDLFIKIRTLEQSRPGRSTLFATGTPISNTMAEMYVMQRYLQNDTLVEYGVDEFDAWAATFGEITTQMELAPNGRTFQETTSFAKFVNIPELVALYSKVADVKTAEMLNLPRPTLKGGAIKVVEAEPSNAEEQYIADLVERAAAMKGKRVEKGGDNMLKIVSEGRKVATDYRLLRPDAEINPDGKIAKAVDNLYRIWKDGKDPGLAQIVFLDMGVPSSKKGAAAVTPT